MNGPKRSHATVLFLAAAPLMLLSACGGDEPARATGSSPGPTCRTEGTVQSKPAESLRAAVEPFMEPGQKFRLSKKVADTAEVQLSGSGGGESDSVVTLVRTRQGWVVTSVTHC